MIAMLLDHLWQSTLFAGCAGALTLALRSNSARIRYWLWFAASLKFLVPFMLLTAMGSALLPPATPVLAVHPLMAQVVRQAAQPFVAANPVPLAPPAAAFAAAPVSVAPGHSLLPLLFALWAIGFAVTLLVWFARRARINAALRSAVLLPVPAPIPVKASSSSFEPGLVGIWKPVLLLPESIAAHLSAQEMNAILAHELCHLRRRDNLMAAFHMLVAALFWFYPLIWWIGARLIDERERACDECVVESGNDPQTYAEGILKVCMFYVQSPLACASGVSGADLKKRVEMIMANRMTIRLSGAKKILLATATAAAVAMPLALGLVASPLALAQTAGAAAIDMSPDAIARRQAEQYMPRKTVAFAPKGFDKFVGYYKLAGSVFTITRKDSHYFGQLTGQPAIEEFPESQTKFFSKMVPAQISFNSDSRGNVAELVLHQAGFERQAPRIDAVTARRMEATFAARVKSQKQSPGTEAALRRSLASLEKGQPNYGELSPEMAAVTRQQLPLLEEYMKKWGGLKSTAFRGVGPGGMDIYNVNFDHGKAEWRISPLTDDSKITGLGFQEMP